VRSLLAQHVPCNDGSRDGAITLYPTDRTVVVATHYYQPGASFELEAYLVGKTGILLLIAHPLYAGGGPSYYRRHEGSRLVREERTDSAKGPFRYVWEVAATRRWVASQGFRFDGFIAADSLLALAGLWLRWRGRVGWVVLYTQDFVPKRFRNRLLNWLYHRVDRFAASRANIVWNVSAEIDAARRRRDGRPGAPSLIVPIGVNFDRIKRVPLGEARRTQLVFTGHLLEKQGLQLGIEAMPAIRRRVPGATLLVIGDGPYRAELERLVGQLGVADAVRFAGFTEDHAALEHDVAESALALAPYQPDPLSFTRFADPTKIKTYLGCGVPIVLTDVPVIAGTVMSAGAGTIVAYDTEALADAVVGYLTDPARLAAAREAAALLGSQFVWSRIFSEAMAETDRMLAAV
jgi:glycosyltransferase involved in cell wall biosynthesis